MSNGLLALGGFAIAVGLPAYYFVIKKRADSLNALLAERFARRPCPIGDVHTELGWIQFHQAYNDTGGSGLVLVLGNLRRSRTAYNRVAGFFKPGGNLKAGEPVKGGDVLYAADVAGGALIVWKGLPSRESVLAHMESVSGSAVR
jgi:hypothetical protein